MNAKTPSPPPLDPALAQELKTALATPPPEQADQAGVAPPVDHAGVDQAVETGAGVPRVVDPAIVSRTARKVVQMLDRGFARNLYAAALRASGGDKEWSAGIVAAWAWSDSDLDDVAELVRETLEMYQAAHMLRPDLLLLLALGTHAAGYLATIGSLRQRAAEAAQISAAAKEMPVRPADAQAR